VKEGKREKKGGGGESLFFKLDPKNTVPFKVRGKGGKKEKGTFFSTSGLGGSRPYRAKREKRRRGGGGTSDQNQQGKKGEAPHLMGEEKKLVATNSVGGEKKRGGGK